VTLALTLFVSIGGVSDADSDDGIPLPARARRNPTRRFFNGASVRFDAMLHATSGGLDLAFRWPTGDARHFSFDAGLVVYLFVINLSSRGFFPQQDVCLHRHSEAGSTFPSPHEARRETRQDLMPTLTFAAWQGRSAGSGRGLQQRQPVHHSEIAHDVKRSASADHLAPSRRQLDRSRAARLSCRRRRRSRLVAGRRGHSFEFTLA